MPEAGERAPVEAQERRGHGRASMRSRSGSTASSMDARAAARIIKLVKNQERKSGKSVPMRVLMSRTSAAVTSRAQRDVESQLSEANIPQMRTAIVERAAYREITGLGGLLRDLDRKEVRNLDKAIENAAAYATEVTMILKEAEQGRGQA